MGLFIFSLCFMLLQHLQHWRMGGVNVVLTCVRLRGTSTLFVVLSLIEQFGIRVMCIACHPIEMCLCTTYVKLCMQFDTTSSCTLSSNIVLRIVQINTASELLQCPPTQKFVCLQQAGNLGHRLWNIEMLWALSLLLSALLHQLWLCLGLTSLLQSLHRLGRSRLLPPA